MSKNEENVVQVVEDPTLLKVNGSKGKEIDTQYVKRLANAIRQTFLKHKVAKLRCVGAASVNNADKAIAIVMTEGKENGIDLVERKSFTDVYFDGVRKTGILKEVSAANATSAQGEENAR